MLLILLAGALIGLAIFCGMAHMGAWLIVVLASAAVVSGASAVATFRSTPET